MAGLFCSGPNPIAAGRNGRGVVVERLSPGEVDAGLGLIDHLEDGVIHEAYPDLTVVIAGPPPLLRQPRWIFF